jgi:hypothetical protein
MFGVAAWSVPAEFWGRRLGGVMVGVSGMVVEGPAGRWIGDHVPTVDGQTADHTRFRRCAKDGHAML